jgi:outer membrane protein TolC
VKVSYQVDLVGRLKRAAEAARADAQASEAALDLARVSVAADAALARFDGVVLTALRETETSLDAYAHDLRRNAALKAARDEAAKAEAQAHALYRAGRSPYLTGLDAQRALAGADAALAASDSQVAADQVNLFLALGGGWER